MAFIRAYIIAAAGFGLVFLLAWAVHWFTTKVWTEWAAL